MTTDRWQRQEELVPRVTLSGLAVQVVGVGAVGRQVAIQLATMGVAELQLIDYDTVEEVNLGAQGFAERDMGLPKVEAVMRSCCEINSQLRLRVWADRWKPDLVEWEPTVVFCGVDTMEARAVVWSGFEGRSAKRLWIDTRMAGETMRVYTVEVHDAEQGRWYRSTLFGDEDAEPARCTARTTIYGAYLTASLAVCQMAKWLRCQDAAAREELSAFTASTMIAITVPKLVTLNATSMEMGAECWETPEEEDDEKVCSECGWRTPDGVEFPAALGAEKGGDEDEETPHVAEGNEQEDHDGEDSLGDGRDQGDDVGPVEAAEVVSDDGEAPGEAGTDGEAAGGGIGPEVGSGQAVRADHSWYGKRTHTPLDLEIPPGDGGEDSEVRAGPLVTIDGTHTAMKERWSDAELEKRQAEAECESGTDYNKLFRMMAVRGHETEQEGEADGL